MTKVWPCGLPVESSDSASNWHLFEDGRGDRAHCAKVAWASVLGGKEHRSSNDEHRSTPVHERKERDAMGSSARR
jgi:hypothetical protein